MNPYNWRRTRIREGVVAIIALMLLLGYILLCTCAHRPRRVMDNPITPQIPNKPNITYELNE
jgi:hypothetical protein